MGGNVRVGMEDSLFASKGVMAKGSADQVEKSPALLRSEAIDIAPPEEAR